MKDIHQRMGYYEKHFYCVLQHLSFDYGIFINDVMSVLRQECPRNYY